MIMNSSSPCLKEAPMMDHITFKYCLQGWPRRATDGIARCPQEGPAVPSQVLLSLTLRLCNIYTYNSATHSGYCLSKGSLSGSMLQLEATPLGPGGQQPYNGACLGRRLLAQAVLLFKYSTQC